MDRTVSSAPTLVDVLGERAATTTSGSALRFVDSGGTVTDELDAAALDRRVCRVAALLESRGLAGKCVVVLLPPGLDYVVAFLGCLYAGAVAVPLYPPPRTRRSPRHDAVLADAQADAVIVPGGTELPVVIAETAAKATILSIDGDLPSADSWARPAICPDTPAFLQYTSGSTATPRGVVVTHANLMANSRSIQQSFGTSPNTAVVSWLPPYHDMGLIGGILQPLYAGCEATLMAPATFIMRPLIWLEQISERGAAISGGPDFAYDLCAERLSDADLDELDLSCWRIAFNGAEPVRAATMDRFAARAARAGFDRAAFFPCYGLAEATLLVSGAPLGSEPTARFAATSLAPGASATLDPAGTAVVSCGPPAPGVIVAIADTGSGDECPDGTIGEIRVAGTSVAAGYRNRPEETAATFPVPGAAGLGLRTGDLGFLHDGRLYVTGRAKDLIVVRGRNHYPHDLERTAQDAHAMVRAGGAAFGLEKDGREELVLVLEISGSHLAERASEIVEAVRAALVREHGIAPMAITLVRSKVVPRTSSGKVQRSLARERWLDGSLRSVYRWTGRPTAPLAAMPEHLWAQTGREAVLAAASRRLGLAVDPAVPLVAQGMDSLAAIEIAAAVTDTTGLQLPLDELLAGVCVDDLALDAAPAAPSVDARAQPAADGARHPLAANQQALWFLEQQYPGTAAQHIYVAVRFLVPIDADALHRAFQGLIDRHPALRTTLHGGIGEPWQEVLAGQDVAFVVEDAVHLDADALSRRLEREAAGELFSLEQGRLLRVVLLRRTDGDVLSLVVHHIAADMWSAAVMMDELSKLYAAETGSGTAPLPELTTDYREFARRQRALIDSPRGEALWEYWSHQLADCTPVLELPADRPRPRAQSYRGDTISVRVDASVTTALRALAAAERTTLFVALLSVFQTLVHRYTGRLDFLVGVPASGRIDPELHGVVGYFVNPVLVRSRMDGSLGFTEHVRMTRDTVVEALRHQDMPFPVLVERLKLQREASRPPGYQVLFSLTTPHLLRDEGLGAFQSGRGGARMRIGALELESLDLVRRTAQVDLTMVLSEVDNHLEGLVNFSTDLFDRSTMERLAEHFTRLATELVARPERAVADAPLALERELALLAAWNNTATEYPADSSLVELFTEQVTVRPDEPAVTFGTTTLTYRELDRASTALARRLRELGVVTESTVGLHVDRDISVVASMLAVAKVGAGYVPLDPAHPPVRLARIVAQASPVVVLASTCAVAGDRPTLVPAEFLDAAVLTDPSHDLPLDAVVHADGLLYVMFTSGSSGTPKGVAITHRNVVRLVRGTGYATFEPGDRIAQISNAAFDAATLEVWGALANGGHLIGFDRDTVLSPPMLAAALRASRVDTVVMATPLFTQLVGHDPATFATVRQLLVGGDTMDPKRSRELVALNGPALTNGYGPTESTTFATAYRIGRGDRGTWRTPIGRPIANTCAYILDDRLHPVPIGVPGHLHVGGDGLARGYVNDSKRTAAAFLPDPYVGTPGARMYATGDLARWLPSGDLDFLGRRDFQVKVRGFRIELGEIDAALCAHPDVLEAVTVAEGEGTDKRLVGYYAGGVDAAQVEAFLHERLPEYMVPPVLLHLPELPKNSNRKIDRVALPAADTAAAAPVAAGGGTREREVAAVLAELLARPDVGPDENFFEIGGHSLLAIRLIVVIRERYDVEMPLNELFDSPTSRAVAAWIDAWTPVTAPGPAPVPVGPTAVPRRAYVRPPNTSIGGGNR